MGTAPTLIFDLDGTLADTAADLCETMNVVLQRHGRARVPEAEVRGLVGGGARLLMDRGFRATGEPASDALLDQLFEEFIGYYSDHIADHTTLFPGLLDQLERLSASGALLAVCTNKVEALSHQLLDRLDIARFFPVVIGGDTLPVKKPRPDPLWECVTRLGGDRASAVMIGDSETDTGAAIAAGMPSVAVSFGYRRVSLDELGAAHIIDHFDQLPAALEAVLPGRFAA